MKLLNKKLETLDGIIPEEEDDDIVRVTNGRFTATEYMNAPKSKQDEDDQKGDY